MRSKFGNQLSVAVVLMNNVSNHSSHGSVSPYQRPKLRRRATIGDVLDTGDFDIDVSSIRTDLTEISLNKTEKSKQSDSPNIDNKKEEGETLKKIDNTDANSTPHIETNRTDISDIRDLSKTTEETKPIFAGTKNELVEKKSRALQNGMSPRQSQRHTLKAKRKTFANRPKSAGPYAIPNIVVTDSKSEEMISVRL